MHCVHYTMTPPSEPPPPKFTYCARCRRHFLGKCWACTLDADDVARESRAAKRRRRSARRRERDAAEREEADLLDEAMAVAAAERASRAAGPSATDAELAACYVVARAACKMQPPPAAAWLNELARAVRHLVNDPDEGRFIWAAGALFYVQDGALCEVEMTREQARAVLSRSSAACCF